MGQNEQEIKLLLNDPGELIGQYQDLINVIVNKYTRLGFVASRESPDLVQDVNQKLLERIERIQKQYNGSCQLRTYFSVIVRNICREEFRKNPKVEEPKPPEYHRLEKSEPNIDAITIRQEYSRFEKVLKLLFEDRSRFVLMLRFILKLEITHQHIENLYPEISERVKEETVRSLDYSNDLTKKESYEIISAVLKNLEGQITSADSLRKWYVSRSNDCLSKMNGHPPRSRYTIEEIQILIEKHEILKK